MKKIFSFVFAVALTTSLWATQIVLQPGSNQLVQAVTNANAGDTLVFQTGTYTESSTSPTLPAKKITLMAAEGATPTLVTYNCKINSDFEINGFNIVNASKDNYLLRTGGNVAGTIAIKNCSFKLHDEVSTPIGYIYLSSNSVGSLLIDNCIFSDNADANGGILRAQSATIGNFTMTNCTGYNITANHAVFCEICTNVYVDHCTFYNCGNQVLYLKHKNGGANSYLVQNCIFSAPAPVGECCIKTYAGDVKNCMYNNASAPRGGDATVTDCVEADPMFKDVAKADFTLKTGSPALTAGVGGTAIGDPRWVSSTRDPKVEVEPGTKTIFAAVAAAQEGDTLILKTGTYTESSSITFDKKLTIMAAADAKPVVEINKWAIKADFEVNGLEITNIESDYMLRTSGNVAGTIAIKNCYMHNSPSSFVYLSSNTVTNLIIDNCVFADNTKTQGAVVYAQAATVTNFTMTNSTMYNCGTELTAWFEGLANAYVNHCMFYNCGTRVLYFKGSATNALVSSSINNTVVSNPTLVNGEAVTPYTGTVSNFVYYNTSDGVNWQATPTNVVNADPQFVDPANGNFNFPITSPLFLAATDGKHIGDPRWTAQAGEGIDLPAELSKANVTSTHADMTYYGANQEYFDFGPTDSSVHLKLWAGWVVNTTKGKFSITADVDPAGRDYTLVLDVIDLATGAVVLTDTAKNKTTFESFDLNSIASGKYFLRLKNTKGWSFVKVKNITITQTGGLPVDMPATLLPDEDHLLLSEYAAVINDSIFFATDDKSWLVDEGWAKWNIKVAEKATYSFTANTCVNPAFSGNGWQYKLTLLNGADTIYSKATAKTWSNGDVANDMGSVVLEPGTYTLMMQNIMNYSKGRLLSVEVGMEYLPLTISEEATDNTVLTENLNKTFAVTLTRSLTAGMFNTLCLPFALSAEQIAESDLAGARIIELTSTSLEDQKLYLNYTEVDAIEAGKGYLIEPAAAVENPVFNGVTITKTAATEETVDAVKVIPTFIVSSIPASTANLYLYLDNTLYYAGQETTIKGMRLYYNVSGTLAPARMRIGSKNTPTTLDEVEQVMVVDGKFIQDGKMYIMKNGVVYNAQGQIVK